MKKLFLLFLSVATISHAAGTDPSLREATQVIGVLRSNYVDREKLDEKLINEATIAGLLQALSGGAVIVTPEPLSTNAPAPVVTEPAVARVEVIEPDIGYIRLADVNGETPAALDTELKKLAQDKVTGILLDLRFAGGTNYSAAATIAGRFLSDVQELFTLKSAAQQAQVFRASAETHTDGLDLTTTPLALLVNAQTAGSAEALAGALRAQNRGIVIGGKTAGSAAGWEDVKLEDGRILRLATAKIILPRPDDAAKPINLFPDGITPDVVVKIDPKIERDVVLGTRSNETLTASLLPRTKKKGITEAELVKVFRGQATDVGNPDNDKDQESDADIRTVRDTVLQRAVDILKGIRVLLSWQ